MTATGPLAAVYGDEFTAADDFFAGWDDEEEAPAEEAPTDDGGNPFKGLEDDMVKHLSDRVKKRMQEQMKGEEADKVLNPESPTSTNESVIKEGSILRTATDVLIRTATTRVALINGVAQLAKASNINIPVRVYRTAVAMESASFADSTKFRACLASQGSQVSPAEIRVLRRLGSIIARWERQNRRAAESFNSGSRQVGDAR
jgi:hypothetical protein